jgi:arginyl-tRNA synthetase
VPDVEITIERPRDPGHGDLATNIALQLAKPLKRKPREIAEEICAGLLVELGDVFSVEVAGPGFINVRLPTNVLTEVLDEILTAGKQYGRSDAGHGRRVNVEFVSANPTGPLHVGHGRGAALGDAISSLLEATGHEVAREFYVNDAGVQIDKFVESVWVRIQEAVGRSAEIPEGGYHGEYVAELAAQILEEEGTSFADLPDCDGLDRCREIAVDSQRQEQDRDLEEFGVRFDVVFRETEVYERELLDETLEELSARELTYEKDGALWLKTAEFGDEKDRVVKKSDGTYTYFMPDVAYHRDKAQRGFQRAIDIWGSDHHGYVARMRAAMMALGLGADFFEAPLVQLVRVMREGKELKFSKRAGTFVTLRELVDAAGVDAARYFFLMRKGDAQFVFDLDLATKQSEENPVYYVQYAHTRMAGIFRKAELDPDTIATVGVDLSLLTEDDEQSVLKHLAEYPAVVSGAAESLEPHRIIAYIDELARLVNGWYHRHRVVGAGHELEKARLVLVRASQIVLANGLFLLGVSAPERM